MISRDDVYHAETDEDEDYPLCYDCHTRSASETAIHDYYYKPEPIFYGEGPRYYGMELELDESGEMSSKAASILETAQRNRSDTLYCKHDGFLNDGFELVTHPMTLEYHQQKMPWKTILQDCVEQGYLSHQARTCGFHIHVSRRAFGTTEEQQDTCIARILYFFEKHWEELLKFSRRTQRQLEHWAARYRFKEQPMEILDHAKKGYHSGRYTCVNLQNRDTIEFRMFRGTLKYNTLIATLQLVDRICNVALFLSDEELKATSWTTFVSGCEHDYARVFNGRQKSRMLPVLAQACEVRGTDATGIAYNTGGALHIFKQPVPTHRLRFHIPGNASVVMGHTRMTTQGSKKKNYNNHPFYGKAGNAEFAFAHNGVIYNDIDLRRKQKLPRTKIQTDSYIAVQLIEQQKALNLDTLRTVAEQSEGSFSFTALDRENQLYFIKGDNPLYSLHYPATGFLIYSSTREILAHAPSRLHLPEESPEQIV